MRRSAVTCSVTSRRRSSPAALGLGLEGVDPAPLGLEDLVELTGDVVVDAAEVVALLGLLAPAPDALEQLAQALDVAAVAVLEPCWSSRRRAASTLAVVKQAVVHLLEHPVGVEVEAGLGPVPGRVAAAGAHRVRPTGCGTSPAARRRPC